MLSIVNSKSLEGSYYNNGDSNNKKNDFTSASKVVDSIEPPVKNKFFNPLNLKSSDFNQSTSNIIISASEVVNQANQTQTNNKIQLVSLKIKAPSASKVVDDLDNK